MYWIYGFLIACSFMLMAAGLMLVYVQLPLIDFNPYKVQPAKIVSESFDVQASNFVSIIIKTMDRHDCLVSLVHKLLDAFPLIQIHIADDGVLAKAHEKELQFPRVHYYVLPEDVGVSYGRNFLVSQGMLLVHNAHTFKQMFK